LVIREEDSATLHELNPERLAAAQHGDGPLLIVAGAGGGDLVSVLRRRHLDRHTRHRGPAAGQGRLVRRQRVYGSGDIAAGVVELGLDAGRERHHAGQNVLGHATRAAHPPVGAAHLDA
jgi:hypothetical protein